MGITDELREWAKEFWEFSYGKFGDKSNLIAIADRIDAEYKKACDDAWDNGYEADYLGIEKWLTEHPQVMEHHGWIRLPLDADGVPIRIGDVIAYKDNTKPKQVVALMPPSVVMVDDGPRYADMCRHYHEPTVEDVMVEFAIDWESAQDAEDKASVLKEYAKRLKLAGEDA